MNLFSVDGRSKEQRLQDSIKELREAGYQVWGPIRNREGVSTPAHLVLYFHDLRAKYHPELETFHASSSDLERSIAKRLIESRMDLGMSREAALSICCAFVETLVKYEQEILGEPVTSLRFLGQESMSWVSDKVWRILEGIDKRVCEDDTERLFQRIYKEEESKSKEDLVVEAIDRMDKILERYGQ